MLTELRVENLLLIERAQLEFGEGFNVFTGETGAGKSLLMDALELLFGAKGDPALVRPGAERTQITARFVLHDLEIVQALEEHFGLHFERESALDSNGVELILSRILPCDGRSKAYANGHPVAVGTLRPLSEHLIDIHGQDQNQSLLRPLTRLEILDRYAFAQEEKQHYLEAWKTAREAAEKLSALRKESRERNEREALYRFQLKELKEAQFETYDPASLLEELKVLRSAESIREATYRSSELLDGEDGSAAASMLKALKSLNGLRDAGTAIEALVTRLDELLTETRELARDLAERSEATRSDPEKLQELEEVHTRWRVLERKHARDLSALIALRDELERKLDALDNYDQIYREYERGLETATEALLRCASALTEKRRKACVALEKATIAELPDLGLKDAKLKLQLASCLERAGGKEDQDLSALLPKGLSQHGAESLELLFSANPEMPLRPLAECASGGELSRVMLALKGVLARIGGADRLPVVVFDEVDTGVGGRLGAVLGQRMLDLAGVRQVLCVTHLPQLAAYAQRQFKVEKRRVAEGTQVLVLTLSEDERVEELAMMLRGAEASAHTRAEAREMLANAQRPQPAKATVRRKNEPSKTQKPRSH